jgi:hypothetical protein
MNAPTTDHEISHGPLYHVAGALGRLHAGADALRHWVSGVRTADPRALYDPVIGIRRQAVWDDHGETYHRAYDGPGIVANVEIPAGIHRISLYLVNTDGHTAGNRWRDYSIEVRQQPGLNLEQA